MKILLLSAYDAQSHKYWRRGLEEAFTEHDWTTLTLPARHFSWRIRGNSLSWAFEQPKTLCDNYDLMIATSMTDLSALRGMVPALAGIPTLVYFHENQFAYPKSAYARASVEPKILNLYTALCADKVVFNSRHNRDTFFAGAEQLLTKLPDHAPISAIQHIKDRTSVLPVPIKSTDPRARSRTNTPGQIIWKQHGGHKSDGPPIKILWAARWEHDKGPELLLTILRKLKDRDTDFLICILGQQFRQTPDTFATIKTEFDKHIVQFGYEESKEKYQQWLGSADIVLSTADHEFQGISVLEAVDAGCVPVLPNKLVYPELFGKDYTYDTPEQAVTLILKIQEKGTAPPDTYKFHWSHLREEYAALIEKLVDPKFNKLRLR